MAKIKAAHGKLAEMLNNQISEVENKVSAETQKIKEMMGLIEKEPTKKPTGKKPAAKKEKEIDESIPDNVAGNPKKEKEMRDAKVTPTKSKEPAKPAAKPATKGK
jgi:hypothetical protein